MKAADVAWLIFRAKGIAAEFFSEAEIERRHAEALLAEQQEKQPPERGDSEKTSE